MDLPKVTVRAGMLCGILLLAGVLFVGLRQAGPSTPPSAPPVEVTARDGSAFAVPREIGAYPAAWKGQPILVFIESSERRAGVEEVRGVGQATPASPLPERDGLFVFALSAKSTHLGCVVSFQPQLGASKDIADYDHDGAVDGRLLDPCSQAQWDAFHRGLAQPASPAPVRLAALDVRVEGDHLVATAFDGPIGPQRS